MSAARHVLRLPDLGLSQTSIVASMWLVAKGREVSEGDRLLEILAGEVTIDLSAPADGILAEKLVAADEPILVGQPLAVIESRDAP
jgi:pyruvate/2-oxoglutarate dehydrogenase complex dihydrolipoamide acyltransferase (E2) component